MGSNMITPNVALNQLKRISLAKPLLLPNSKTGELVTISPPQTATAKDTIQVRVLSSELREGMQHLDDPKSPDSPALFNGLFLASARPAPAAPRSPHLILHVHGGGFIAHSSKSHEIYLKPWCKELKVPVVSVDYSLAPEHMFPRASEECFYVYAWCLLNRVRSSDLSK
jgi:hormone-sensitive lipase